LIAALPRLRSLSLAAPIDKLAHPTLSRLELAGAFKQPLDDLPALTELAIATDDDPSALLKWLATSALGGRKLARLDLAKCHVPAAWLEPLAKITGELVVANVVPEKSGTFVRHRNKPEWGRGRVVREFDGKIEIAFPAAGTKVFRKDATFLEPS
jgi:hypothetical protein